MEIVYDSPSLIQLKQFYRVDSIVGLIEAQNRHIEKLIIRLGKYEDATMPPVRKVREG